MMPASHELPLRVTLALALASFVAAPAAAQERAIVCPDAEERAPSDARPTALDAWLTRPVVIELSQEQRARVCELRAAYREEFDALSGGEMQVVRKAMALQVKYGNLVRALLTPEQQAVFDRNFRGGGG